MVCRNCGIDKLAQGWWTRKAILTSWRGAAAPIGGVAPWHMRATWPSSAAWTP